MDERGPNYSPYYAPFRKAERVFAANGIILTAANTTSNWILVITDAQWALLAGPVGDSIQALYSITSGVFGGECDFGAADYFIDSQGMASDHWRGYVPLYPGDSFGINAFDEDGGAVLNAGAIITGYWQPFLNGLPYSA